MLEKASISFVPNLKGKDYSTAQASQLFWQILDQKQKLENGKADDAWSIDIYKAIFDLCVITDADEANKKALIEKFCHQLKRCSRIKAVVTNNDKLCAMSVHLFTTGRMPDFMIAFKC